MINIYYTLKPLIPRWLQIATRRQFVLRKRRATADIWPIDEEAKYPPDGWNGWPGQKRFVIMLQHDVDTQKGRDKCHNLMELEEKLGVRSSFNFVAERYKISDELLETLRAKGFEIGVHGLKHDGKLFSSRKIFEERAIRINHYLKSWNVQGFTSPSMHHNLEWMQDLTITHATSTFDTDPFEPQPDGMKTIFPLWVQSGMNKHGYVEIPYTMPQDFTLFILMCEKDISIWKQKLDWIAKNGGMALVNTHPDYMNFSGEKCCQDEYPVQFYEDFIHYFKSKYDSQYWQALPREMAQFWRENIVKLTYPFKPDKPE